ncbi:MAG: helix-turn-helix transcriptional regulator [Firmicutes bacterium]|nr:helix-turn-helix transcriptional regulator [Bacillota bacterium]
MDLTLAENIRKYRKERKLTQETLAEILGVTTGAVYKWESGMSIPELDLIVKMADFFDVSVDALLGYRMQDNRLEQAAERIQNYVQKRDPRAMTEVEKLLTKYPHMFSIVHGAAEVYIGFGTINQGKKELHRALELLERSLLLISQNQEPRINEHMIYAQMAQVYVLLGEKEKGLDLWKKHNVGGLFDDIIGVSLVFYLHRPEEAEPFLNEAFLQKIISMINTVAGLVLLFCSHGDYSAAEEIALWGIRILESLKANEQICFMDKLHAVLLILLAHTMICKGKPEEAANHLENAAVIAKAFDASPDYSLRSIRFVPSVSEAVVYDTLGTTARESIETIISTCENQTLSRLWKEYSSHA